MRTRNLAFLICCLATSNALAASGIVPEGAELVPTPAAGSSNMQACPIPVGSQPCETPATPPTAPWYYWWSSWHWFDNCHDRGQHYPYLPPLPGWYYFRPYSVGQLRAQQEAVMQWGGDPRNPYAGGIVQQQPQLQPQSQRSPQRELPTPPAPPATAKNTSRSSGELGSHIEQCGAVSSVVGGSGNHCVRARRGDSVAGRPSRREICRPERPGGDAIPSRFRLTAESLGSRLSEHRGSGRADEEHPVADRFRQQSSGQRGSRTVPEPIDCRGSWPCHGGRRSGGCRAITCWFVWGVDHPTSPVDRLSTGDFLFLASPACRYG